MRKHVSDHRLQRHNLGVLRKRRNAAIEMNSFVIQQVNRLIHWPRCKYVFDHAKKPCSIVALQSEAEPTNDTYPSASVGTAHGQVTYCPIFTGESDNAHATWIKVIVQPIGRQTSQLCQCEKSSLAVKRVRDGLDCKRSVLLGRIHNIRCTLRSREINNIFYRQVSKPKPAGQDRPAYGRVLSGRWRCRRCDDAKTNPHRRQSPGRPGRIIIHEIHRTAKEGCIHRKNQRQLIGHPHQVVSECRRFELRLKEKEQRLPRRLRSRDPHSMKALHQVSIRGTQLNVRSDLFVSVIYSLYLRAKQYPAAKEVDFFHKRSSSSKQLRQVVNIPEDESTKTPPSLRRLGGGRDRRGIWWTPLIFITRRRWASGADGSAGGNSGEALNTRNRSSFKG